jgi:opacity protein-like surface antigen
MTRSTIRRSTHSVAIACSVLLFLIAAPPSAAQQVEESRGVTLEIIPYLWTFGTSGEIRSGFRTVPIDYSIGDVASFVDRGFSAQVEVREQRFAILLNAMFVEFSEDFDTLRTDVEHFVGEVYLGYRVIDDLDLLVGGRYYNLKAVLTQTGAVVSDQKHDWLDLVVGARYRWDISSKGLLRAQGDIGGSGSGSDFAWGLNLALHYKLLEQLTIGLGYRVLGVDYRTGQGFDLFEYNVSYAGPGLGAMFIIN